VSAPVARAWRAARASVRLRVTTVAATVTLAATTLGSVLFVLSLESSLQAGLLSDVRQEVRSIHAQLADGASPAQVVITGRGDVLVQLLDRRGRVIAADHPSLRRRPLVTRPGRHRDVKVPDEGEAYTVVARRLATGPVRLIVAGRSSQQVARAGDDASDLLLLAVPVVTALLALTVWFSVGRALRPVERLRREADAITSAHQGRRLALPAGNDEIPRLAHTLNEMLERIEHGQLLQRQFVSDASHELRSPLSVIRQSAEVARAYPERVSVATLAGDVLAESARLGGLVEALLLLARLDDGVPVPTEDLDLDDVVLAEVERARATAGTITLDVSHVSGGQVHGNAVLLAQLVRNLVANAVRHAAGVVTIALRECDGSVELVVDDDGDGVSPEDRERVFDRFVRLDEGRARDDGGSGLGLAIVRTIAATAGGSVSLDSTPVGGARFVVALPAVG